MTLEAILLIVIVACLILLAVSGIIAYILSRRVSAAEKREKRLLAQTKKLTSNKQTFIGSLGYRLYPYLNKIPIVKGLLRKARSRYEILSIGNERVVRSQSALTVLVVVYIIIIFVVAAMTLVNSITTQIVMVISAIYVASIIMDNFVEKATLKGLEEQYDAIMILRHEFHQSGMIGKAFRSAGEKAKPLAGVHLKRIADTLEAKKPDEELREYYDIAPNDYIKRLAGAAHMVRVYGDTKVGPEQTSLFLVGLMNIRKDMHMRLMYMKRLNQKLSGLPFMILVPLFCIEPLRNWSEGSMPVVGKFFDSSWGLWSLMIIYAAIFTSFTIFRFMKVNNNNSDVVSGEGRILRKMRKNKYVEKFVNNISPTVNQGAYLRAVNKLKTTNSKLDVKDFYLKKTLTSVVAILLLLSILLYIPYTIKMTVIAKPNVTDLDGLDYGTYQTIEREIFESDVLGKIISEGANPEDVPAILARELGKKTYLLGDKPLENWVMDLEEKLKRYNNAYFKWYELLVILIVGVLAFFVQDAYLVLKQRMQQWEMQNEVDRISSIFIMISQVDRMNVYTMLTWMYVNTNLFSRNIFRAMLTFHSGPVKALEELRDSVNFVPFQRLVDRLIVSTERITIKKAFDDLVQEESFAQNERQLHYDTVIDKRASMASMISMVPLGAVIIFYLVGPILFVTMMELGNLTTITSRM